MKVQTILATKRNNVITIEPHQLVREAVAKLNTNKIGALVVVSPDNKKPVGIISERDVVYAAARNENVFCLTVADLMSSPVITATPNDELFAVMHTMTKQRIRHLPIMNGDQLVDIISIGDIIKIQRDTFYGEVTNLEIQIMANDNP